MPERSMEKQSFPLSLALVDALPVLFFGAAAAILGVKLRSVVFIVGAALCLLAGAGKVVWKLLLALKGKDVALLGAQLRYVMPLGFLLMILGGIFAERETVRALLHAAVRLPSAAFFALTIVGIIAMIVCAKKFDRFDVRANWIEQGINAAAQACAMIGVLLL